MNKSEKKSAVALKYDRESGIAPTVSAKGHGVIAEKIIELAEKHNIPIKKDKDLVQLLSVLDLNDLIPPDLYQTIAEILAYVYQINKKVENER